MSSVLPSFVYVLRVAPLDAVAYTNEDFATVRTDGADSIGALKIRACAAFPNWGVDAGQVTIFHVPNEARARAIQHNPSSAADILNGASLFATDPVGSGSFLLARVPSIPPPVLDSSSTGQLTALTAASADMLSQLTALTAAVTALTVFQRSPKSATPRGGTRTPTSTSGGSGSPIINPVIAALCTKFAALSSPLLSLSSPLVIDVGTDSRSLPPHMQRILSAHRLVTPQRMEDFEFVATSGELWLQPSLKKGMSLFVVLSDDPDVIAAAHAARCAVTRVHHGCTALRLSEVPDSLTLTFERVLERASPSSASPVIVWHATLAPKKPMLDFTFLAAFAEWTKQLCAIEAAAEECPPDIFVDPSDLGVMSSSLEPYFAYKLAAFTTSQPQPAGGSPGM